MKPKQLALFALDNELKKNFTPEFFKTIPRRPGVYFFKGANGEILYVGKAKSLRNRIQSYKQISAEKSPRKLVRLVHRIRTISWELCESEEHAYIRENHYLAELKPPYNRMNTVPEHYWYLHIIDQENQLRFQFSKEEEPTALRTLGAFKSKNRLIEMLKAVLRLHLFLGRPSENYRSPSSLQLKSDAYTVSRGERRFERSLLDFFSGKSERWIQRAKNKVTEFSGDEFEKFQLFKDVEHSQEFFEIYLERNHEILSRSDHENFVPKEDLDNQLVKMRLQDQEPAQ